MDKETIKRILLAHGFTIKQGEADLKPYVYSAASAIYEAALQAAQSKWHPPETMPKDMDKAMLAAAPDAQGEPVAWSGWGCQHPGKMPRLYGERRIAELNCDWENGDQLLHFTAAPQPADQQPAPEVAGLMGVLGQYFDAMDSIGREGTATSTLIAEAKCDEAEARLRLFLAAHRKQGGES